GRAAADRRAGPAARSAAGEPAQGPRADSTRRIEVLQSLRGVARCGAEPECSRAVRAFRARDPCRYARVRTVPHSFVARIWPGPYLCASRARISFASARARWRRTPRRQPSANAIATAAAPAVSVNIVALRGGGVNDTDGLPPTTRPGADSGASRPTGSAPES